MAIFVDFEMVGEDDQQVVYAFGLDQRMDRRLVIDKQIEEAAPLDGSRDIGFSGALRKIMEGRRHLGHWPQRGVYAA